MHHADRNKGPGRLVWAGGVAVGFIGFSSLLVRRSGRWTIRESAGRIRVSVTRAGGARPVSTADSARSTPILHPFGRWPPPRRPGNGPRIVFVCHLIRGYPDRDGVS